MADLTWIPTTPLARALVPGRHGSKHGAAGLQLTEYRDFELVQVMARRGQWDALAAVVTKEFGVSLPKGPEAVDVGGALLVWSGPGQFLVLRPRVAPSSLNEIARRLFAPIASISDQSDGRALLCVAGPDARNALAKCCSLDLHAKSFGSGKASATSIDHTPVNLWRGQDATDGVPTFYLLVFSTFAESLLGTIIDAGAEYGVQATAAEPWQP